MNSINDKITMINKLYHVKGCSLKQIIEAQNDLGIAFPDEYIDILKKYGAISFFGTEWTGLNVDNYQNVIYITKQERNLNPCFPPNCFVLENQGIDGILIICNEKGEVFSLQHSKIKKIHNSISNYLNECINRKMQIK